MSQGQANGNSLFLQGRIVWTSGKTLFEGAVQKDDRTKQIKYDQHGNQVVQFGFGLAIPKVDPTTGQHHPEYVKAYQALHGEALTLYPNGQIPPVFAYKYKDGDGVDHTGAPFNTREGYAGHIVIACTTYIPLKCFIWQNGNNILVNDGIKCGDYVNVQLNIKAHHAVGQGKAGLYVNPSAVQLIAPGKEIINTPSGDQLFGVNAPQFSGQMVAPEAPTIPNVSAPMPGGYAQPAPAGMPPMSAPMTQQQYAQPPIQQPAPSHYGVLPGQFQGQPAPAGMPPMSAPMTQQQYAQPPMQQAGGMPMPPR